MVLMGAASGWLRDLRFGKRFWCRQPVVAVVAIVTLGLGIAATTASFSAVDTVLLRRLPFPEPDQLMAVWSVGPDGSRAQLSYPDYRDLVESNQSFASLAAYHPTTFKRGGEQKAERVRGAFVSASYFPLLGVRPGEGRFISEQEDTWPGPQAVAVLSYAYWQRQFGGDTGVIGQPIELDGISFTVVGVGPRHFGGLDGEADVWVPVTMFREARPQFRLNLLTTRQMRWFDVVGRLDEDVSFDQAKIDATRVAEQLETTYPDTNKAIGIAPQAMGDLLTGHMETALLAPLIAAGLVLLIGCINIANMLLSQVGARRREAALRMAIGSQPWRLIRQLLTESLLLALPAGVLGIALAAWAVRGFGRSVALELPAYLQIGIDARVAAFCLLLTVLTGVLFGLVPALRLSRTNLTTYLREGGRGMAGGWRDRLRRSIPLVAEIALAFVLLVAAGLLLRSYGQLQQIDPGYEASRLISIKLDLPVQHDQGRLQVLSEAIISELEAVPGVAGVGLDSDVFLGGEEPLLLGLTLETVEGASEAQTTQVGSVRAYRHTVTPQFFGRMQIPLVAGRDIQVEDRADTKGVVIVSRTMAERFWPGEDVVGKRLKPGGRSSPAPWLSVVGVAEDVRHRSLVAEAGDPPDIYFPLAQARLLTLGLMVRGDIDPATLEEPILRTLQSVDPDVVAYDVATVAHRVDQQVADIRFTTRLTTFFGLLAVLLAAIGVFSVMTYTVAQRTREIGIRMAMGATGGTTIRQIMMNSLRIASVGLALGLGLSLAGGRWVEARLGALLYQVQPNEPSTLVAAFLMVLVAVVAACYLPARRAARVDPMVALRHE